MFAMKCRITNEENGEGKNLEPHHKFPIDLYPLQDFRKSKHSYISRNIDAWRKQDRIHTYAKNKLVEHMHIISS